MAKNSTLCRQFFIVFLQFYFVVTKNTLKHVIKAVLSKALVQRCSEIMRSKKTTQFLQENTYVGVSFLILLTVSTFAFWCYKLLLQKQPFTNDLESSFSVKFSKSTADTGVGEWGVEGGEGGGWAKQKLKSSKSSSLSQRLLVLILLLLYLQIRKLTMLDVLNIL